MCLPSLGLILRLFDAEREAEEEEEVEGGKELLEWRGRRGREGEWKKRGARRRLWLYLSAPSMRGISLQDRLREKVRVKVIVSIVLRIGERMRL